MKKRNRILVTVLIMAVMAVMLSGCVKQEAETPEEPTKEELRIEELKQQVDDLSNQVATLTSQLEQAQALANSSDTDFINTFFWSSGGHYEDEDTTFYSDCYCSQEITDPVVFVSKQTVGVDLKNGLYVYAALSTDGIVWSTEGPDLDPIEEDE